MRTSPEGSRTEVGEASGDPAKYEVGLSPRCNGLVKVAGRSSGQLTQTHLPYGAFRFALPLAAASPPVYHNVGRETPAILSTRCLPEDGEIGGTGVPPVLRWRRERARCPFP